MQIIFIFISVIAVAALTAALIITRNALKGAKKQAEALGLGNDSMEAAKLSAEQKANDARLSEARAVAGLEAVEASLREQKGDAERTARDNAGIIRDLTAKLAAAEEQVQSKQREIEAREKNFAELSEKSRLEFKDLANRLFSEKAKEFSGTNEASLKAMLDPLSEKIVEFRKTLADTSTNSTKNLAEFSAKFTTEIANMQKMNTELQSDAKGLTTALRGDTQKQGRWGEIVLQKILENSGLEEGTTFELQDSFKAEGETLRPDAIVYLPENKCVVIDSKVSLTAYDRFVNAATDEERASAMKEHIASLQKHVEELAEKDYGKKLELARPGTKAPEYTLMFVPVESGLGVALQYDQGIFLKAWEKRIIVVSPSTLVATLMTIASIWKQEKQRENVEEIARRGGKLFDKLCGFLDDFKKIDSSLQKAEEAYTDALRKLSDGRDSAIDQAERLKELGAKTAKELPDLQGK